MRILMLFVLVPLVELFLLLKLADWISGWWTFVLVVVTGVVGATLARRQGFGVIDRIQRQLQAGQLPTSALIDALMIFVAGALLITPGILTDLFGFSLLIPFCRRTYRGVLRRWLTAHVHVETYHTVDGHAAGPSDRVIDAEVIEHQEDPRSSG